MTNILVIIAITKLYPPPHTKMKNDKKRALSQ
jgi:hypothetical protein